MSAVKEKPLELAVIVKGEIVTSNFSEFARMVDTQLAEINTDLKTDKDFGQAEKDVKGLEKAEDNIKEIKTNLLDQMTEVNELLKGLDEKDEDVRQKRLELARQIKSKKAEIKKQHEDDAVESIKVDWRDDFRSQVAGAMKGKSNLESIRKATQEVADQLNKKHEANKAIVNAAMKEHGAGIAPDHRALLDMDESALRDQISSRVELKKSEDERKQLEAERMKAEKELAEMKRQEAEKLQAANDAITMGQGEVLAKPEETPAPPKIDSIPTTGPGRVVFSPDSKLAQEEVTAWEEKAEFLKVVEAAFAPVKAARSVLKHPENIKSGQEFAEDLLAVWTTFKNKN